MSVSESESNDSKKTPLHDVLVSHLSTFFSMVTNILENFKSTLGDKMHSLMWQIGKLVRIMLSRLLLQAIVFCTSLDSDCQTAQKLIHLCSALANVAIDICNLSLTTLLKNW